MDMSTILHDIYNTLYASAGPQNWWPASSSFEMMVGALLTQNTSWRNVEYALDKLGHDITPYALLDMPLAEIEEKIRPCGYFRMKASRLKELASWCLQWGYHPDAFTDIDTKTLRGMLLTIKGVGRETADSILLYSLNKPIFVVDTYTRRMLSRVFNDDSFLSMDYDDVSSMFHSCIENDLQIYNEYHALIVHLCKEYCLKTTPSCKKCPLNGICLLVDSVS